MFEIDWPLFFLSRYKSGLICICHVDLEGNRLNLLHKLSPDSSNTVCCSIQFAHVDSPLGQFRDFSFLYKAEFLFYRSQYSVLHQLCSWLHQSVRLYHWEKSRSNPAGETIEKHQCDWSEIEDLLSIGLDRQQYVIDRKFRVREREWAREGQTNDDDDVILGDIWWRLMFVIQVIWRNLNWMSHHRYRVASPCFRLQWKMTRLCSLTHSIEK